MTEEEIVDRSHKSKAELVDDIVAGFAEARFMMSNRFCKVLMEEIEKARKMSVETQLNIKKERFY